MTTSCRDAEDPTKPCKFAGVCHESRQRIAQDWDARGPACPFYETLEMDERYPGAPREAA